MPRKLSPTATPDSIRKRKYAKAHAARSRIRSRTPRARHKHLLFTAKRRGLLVTITEEQHAALLTLPCHYCGGKLWATGVGLDRADSSRGYHPDNVRPCCWWCNGIKGAHLTEAEMLAHIGPAIRAIREARERAGLPSGGRNAPGRRDGPGVLGMGSGWHLGPGQA